MLTDNKEITTPEYWSKIYAGKNDNAPVDASNTVRTSTFDRFAIVINHVEGPKVLDIGAGHARICQRLKHKYPDWFIVASDQSEEAKKVTPYRPYEIFSGYNVPYPDKFFDTVIASQCLEYFEDLDKLINEVKRVGKSFVCTIPIGSMAKWSQLYEFNEEDFTKWLSGYGKIIIKSNYGELLMAKIRFE